MARICCIVMNSVSRDSRVLKEAESLVKAGHDVTIVGLVDKEHRNESEVLQNGVRVRRVVQKYPDLGGRIVKEIRGGGERVLKDAGLLIGALGFVFLCLTYLRKPSLDEKFDFIIISIGLMVAIGMIGANQSLLKACRLLSNSSLRILGHWFKRLGIKRIVLRCIARCWPSLLEQENQRRMRLRTQAMAIAAKEAMPAIIHCHDVHTLPVGAELRKTSGCRVVYDAHEIYEEVAQGDKLAAERYRRTHLGFFPIVDRFITINDSIAQWYVEHYPDIPQPAVIMNASPLQPPFVYDGRLHEAAGLKREDRILLYQGGFAEKRGLEYLLRVAEHLADGWFLVMMGWGRTEQQLRNQAEAINRRAEERGRGAPVRFVGPAPQSELALWTAGGTVGVIPYENVGLNHWFCTPNKLWEYPCAGVPVLVSPFPELRKPVERYGFGWLLPEVEDPIGVASIVNALTNGEIARAREACAVFMENENWEKYGQRLVSIYDELVRSIEQDPATV